MPYHHSLDTESVYSIKQSDVELSSTLELRAVPFAILRGEMEGNPKTKCVELLAGKMPTKWGGKKCYERELIIFFSFCPPEDLKWHSPKYRRHEMTFRWNLIFPC